MIGWEFWLIEFGPMQSPYIVTTHCSGKCRPIAAREWRGPRYLFYSWPARLVRLTHINLIRFVSEESSRIFFYNMSKDVSIQMGLPFLFHRVFVTRRLFCSRCCANSRLRAGCVFSPTAAAQERCKAAILWQLGLVVFCSCHSSQMDGWKVLLVTQQKLQLT